MDLIQPHDFLGTEYSFTIHGSPMGTPFQVAGKFAKRTPVAYC
jgi:hypothetical protein